MNETLRSALAAKGIDKLALASALQVDPKTVERWLSGRLPHPRSRQAIAELVGLTEARLWPPNSLNDASRASRFGPEIRAVYPHRWSVPRHVWHDLFAGATREIDILVYSGLFLFEDPGIIGLFTAKAKAGVDIRLLLGDPESPEVAQRGEDEGVAESFAGRIHNALALIRPLIANDVVELRLHRSVLYTSIFRADNELIANPHIYGTPAPSAPVLHLRCTADSSLFRTYIQSIRQTWHEGHIWAPDEHQNREELPQPGSASSAGKRPNR